MKLSDELYQQIIQAVVIVGEEQPMEADRRAQRLNTSVQVTLIPWAHPEDTLNVRLRNLSNGGVGILHRSRLALDEQFVLRLAINPTENRLLLFTVVYWEPLAEDLYSIGAQFERLVEEAELIREPIAETGASHGLITRLSNVFRKIRIAS